MEEVGQPSDTTIAKRITSFVEEKGRVLDKVEECLSASSTLEEFHRKEFEAEYRIDLIRVRGEMYKALSVVSMDELKELIARYKESEAVQTAFEDLLDVDRKWDSFAVKLEARAAQEIPLYAEPGKFLDVGDQLSQEQKQLVLTQSPSEEKVVFNELISSTPYTLLTFYRAIG